MLRVAWQVSSNAQSLCRAGGDFDSERQMDDLKLLYKAYLAEALESGSLSDDKVG